MKVKVSLLMGLIVTALCSGSSCPQDAAKTCASYTTEGTCNAYSTCSWNSAASTCGDKVAPPAPTCGDNAHKSQFACQADTSCFWNAANYCVDATCSGQGLSADCTNVSTQLEGGCFWTAAGACVSTSACSNVVLEADCNSMKPLVAGSCQWNPVAGAVTTAFCGPDTTSKCNFQPDACDQYWNYTGSNSNQAACELVKVNNARVCTWSTSNVLYNKCVNAWPVAGTDPCNSSTATATTTSVCTGYGTAGACDWN